LMTNLRGTRITDYNNLTDYLNHQKKKL
jgi:hypothetical protein